MGKLNPEDKKLSRREFNRHVVASDWYHRSIELGQPELSDRPHLRDPDVIKISHTSALPRGSLVGIGNPIIDPLDPQNLWFERVIAALGEPFAITLRQSPPNSIVEALVAGVCLARVNVTDTDHRYAEINSGALLSGNAGVVRFLQEPTTTGVQELAVRFPREDTAIRTGVLTDQLDPGSWSNVAELDLNALNQRIFTGRTFVVWDLMLNDADYIESGTVIQFAPMSLGRYQWVSAMCRISDNLP